jgi:outer membrane protein insertion porin family
VQIEGAEHVDTAQLTPLLNTAPGQLLSPRSLAGDRDALVTSYLSRGFEQPQVDVTEKADPVDPAKVDVVFHITEGPQVFVRKVLLTGLHFTRRIPCSAPSHPSRRSADQTALADTQRNLYEFALFNEVNTAVENPSGGDTSKTVLLQAVEARRWALTYGFGFEAQTGTPHYNCGLIIVSGAVCNSEGKTGVSPRVIADITRNNLFGREQSASLQVTYGLLEQKIDLLFQVPHLNGDRNFGFNLSGGYANSLDVTTYVASKLEGGMRWTQHFNPPQSLLSKANTFVYEFNFRRVKVQANSLQVAHEIALLSTAVRVGGSRGYLDSRYPRLAPRRPPRHLHQLPGVPLRQDLRRAGGVQPARRLELQLLELRQEAIRPGPQHPLRPGARLRHSGSELIPLPERLYAGGATSLRGFSVNAAGPRDPETGYPTAEPARSSTARKCACPRPPFPFFGNALSLVVFHDMGNVFSNASDAWPSALRFRQPDRDACRNPVVLPPSASRNSTGLEGPCSFNYFSHALGTGLRYHTPAGPIRLDFSYNLNPPIFPVVYDYSNSTAPPTVGEASHFNFFFSLGQSF